MRDIAIGIDPGTKTGYAAWNMVDKAYVDIQTVSIHVAMAMVLKNASTIGVIVIEDPTGISGSRAKIQGAGSIKRDFRIWTDYLDDLGITYIARRPHARMLKLREDIFKKMTGWQGRTSHHARDAAMLVHQFTKNGIPRKIS